MDSQTYPKIHAPIQVTAKNTEIYFYSLCIKSVKHRIFTNSKVCGLLQI